MRRPCITGRMCYIARRPMDGTLRSPRAVALAVTRQGDLVALLPGQRAGHISAWQVHAGKAQVGERLLGLTEGTEPAAPDLVWGRELALRVVRAAAAAPGDEARVTPADGELAALLAAAPAM